MEHFVLGGVVGLQCINGYLLLVHLSVQLLDSFHQHGRKAAMVHGCVSLCIGQHYFGEERLDVLPGSDRSVLDHDLRDRVPLRIVHVKHVHSFRQVAQVHIQQGKRYVARMYCASERIRDGKPCFR